MTESEDEFRKEEYRAHMDTYERFTALTKYSAIAVAVILVLMAIFLL
ncbi:aa3-type cytochrome c oxidase subunit IV [Skermanella stibiiresistens]|nr:aa3-type cytochrome c oxidase subunit IV [Skermanella stibiiresistens]